MLHNAASLNLDHTHCRAICDEIGERLGFILKQTASDIPPRLLYLIGKLAELDSAALPRLESAPSIVPSIEDMSGATTVFNADAA
jgi:hypothetical protein